MLAAQTVVERLAVSIRRAVLISGASRSTLLRWAREGRLPCARSFNGAPRFFIDDLLRVPEGVRPTRLVEALRADPLHEGQVSWPPTLSEVVNSVKRSALDVRTPEDRERQMREACERYARAPRMQRRVHLARTAERYGLTLADFPEQSAPRTQRRRRREAA